MAAGDTTSFIGRLLFALLFLSRFQHCILVQLLLLYSVMQAWMFRFSPLYGPIVHDCELRSCKSRCCPVAA